ncbi:MAG TPA: MoaD/ThiS family protein [bacterium]|nr:MoaD/ThiS family protein [bacterium]
MDHPIRVEIRYLSIIRDKTGCRREQVSFPAGSRLQNVADWLNDRYTLPKPQMMTLLNGRGWKQYPQELSTKIKEGDTITLAPILSGG